jgi:chromosome partitioning protein
MNMRIAVFNQKGGAGKSTLVAHIGFRAIERNQSLVVFDSDRQLNSIDWLANHEWSGEPYQNGSIFVTNDGVYAKNRDSCIIDCPPSINVVDEIENVDVWLIPVSGRFSGDGAINVLHSLKESNARKILISNMALSSEFGKDELKALAQIDCEVFKFPIQQQELVRKAEMLGIAAWQVPYGMRSSSAQNLKLFSDWVLDGCSVKGLMQGNKELLSIQRGYNGKKNW